MNYKVLYRKYRPNTFESVVGQKYIIKTLKNSIINNNISHAYIFSGPRGTGKTSTAKIFSRAINCIKPNEGSPCGECEFCRNFVENPDIIEIDAASNNGVDEIRNLIDNIKLTPTNGKYKVYIIDEVHMLTTSAFNALLLTLEEPPSHAVFILATTNIESVPITILSRCQRFDFKKICIDEIIDNLRFVCSQENINIDDEALTEIAYLSEGGMRDALSLLDQLSKNKENITLELVESEIKTISQSSIQELFDSIEKNDVQTVLLQLDDFRKMAIDYKTFIKKIIDVASTQAKNIKKAGKYQRLMFDDYKNLIIDLTECLTKININVDPYIILEMIFLEYLDISMTNNNYFKEESSKITEKKDNIEINNLKDFNEELIKIRINNCFVNVQKSYLELAKKEIGDLATSLNDNGKLKSILFDSVVVAASDKNLIFSCSSNHEALTANKMIEEIEKIIKKTLNKDYKVIFLSQNRWNSEKENYIANLKANIKYEFIEEPITEESTEPIINDVFDISKVEII